MPKQKAIMLLMTQAYSRGGVQAYSRRVAEILSQYAERRGFELHGISLQDDRCRSEEHPNPVRFASFRAAAGSRLHFVDLSARAAWNTRPRVVVVMHTCIAPAAFVLRVARMIGPYILVLHGIESWQRMKPGVRAAARGAGRIVATTRYTVGEFASANGVGPEKFSVIPLAIPESQASITPPAPTGEGLRVLAAGRLSATDAYKGFDVLIRAVGRAREAGANIKLTIVGAGDDLVRLQALAAALQLRPATVKFLGEVPDLELRRQMESCHVFALPSRGEGFGIVYLEAMSAGRPCIAGNHGGPTEIISDGRDGFLVQHGDVAELAQRLLTLYREPELHSQLGANAALTVKNKYLFPHMREAWFNLLDTACE